MEEMLSSISFIDESPLRNDCESPPCMNDTKDYLIAGEKGRGRDEFLAAPQKGNPNPYISVENAPLFANNRVLNYSRVAGQKYH